MCVTRHARGLSVEKKDGHSFVLKMSWEMTVCLCLPLPVLSF